MGLLVASRPARLWLALTENHAGQRLSVSPLHVPDHIAVALAGAAPTARALSPNSSAASRSASRCAGPSKREISSLMMAPPIRLRSDIGGDEALGLDA
jgi:hypothetical protein